jgi:hypothetical protein
MGNKNSGRRQEKPFADALRMEVKAAGTNHKALRVIACKLVELAMDGNLDAIKVLADRLDGKPIQQQILSGDEEAPLIPIINVHLRNQS